MSEPNVPAIELVDVVKTFDRGVLRPLDGASLTIMQGEWVALSGPSGCGKSTLLHLIAALDSPTSGKVIVNGEDISGLRDVDGYRRNVIGLVFQLHNLLPVLSAIKNVEIAMLGTGLAPREQRARARELLEAVGLGHRTRVKPPRLSGGERQRLAIARALANRPRILLADEPTGSLDSASSKAVLDLFRKIREERGLTILLVTHDPSVAAQADRIIRMQDGRIVSQGDN
ncbi:MAG: ABC transporter ATP-binding protein [Dehalococcoidia bacterium]